MEFVNTLVLALGLNAVGFAFAYWLKSDKLTDFMYGTTFLAIAVFAYSGSEKTIATTVLLALVTLWSLRLAFFLLLRVVRNKRDKRFDGVRENFWKFGQFWLFQAVTAWVIMLPAIYLFTSPPAGINGWMYGGLAIWLVGFLFESASDWQKFTFGSQPSNKDKWIDSGLWAYSRHPNYFGEILIWIGIYLYSLPALGTSAAFVSILSPLWITYLLLFVTGVPKLEEYADKKWGANPKYLAYKARVPLIVPKFKP